MPSAPARNRLFLVLACAIAATGAEWPWQTVPRDQPTALWVVWSFCFLVPSLLLTSIPRLRRLPPLLIAWATLFPATAICLHQIAHEHAWPHLALGVGGLEHWSRVAGLVGALLLLPAWLLARCERSDRLQRQPRVVALLTVLLAVGLGVASVSHFLPRRAVARTSPAATAPNLLLISIDTLRQDALACYGGRPTALDPWLADAQVLRGFAPAPWTLPSLRALMQGAAHSGAGAARARGAAAVGLPQRLQAAGFATGAVVTNAHLMSDFGFSAGFDDYDHSDQLEPLLPARRAKLVRWWTREWTERRQLERGDRRADAALRWLRKQDDAQPWFLWLHLLDPHLPYFARGSEGALRPQVTPPWIAALGEGFQDGSFSDLSGLRSGLWPMDGPFLAALRELYASEVDFAAWQSARVLAAARKASGKRPLVWILTSDHGEEFFEHGGFEHGHTLYQELLRVPLVIGGVEESLPSAMRLQDIAPWWLQRLELPALPAPATVPEELRTWVLGGAGASGCALDLLAGGMLYGEPQLRWIRDEGTSTLWSADGTSWRNDVCRDEGDRDLQAVAADSSELALQRAVGAWRALELPASSEADLDADVRERLKALGYLGG